MKLFIKEGYYEDADYEDSCTNDVVVTYYVNDKDYGIIDSEYIEYDYNVYCHLEPDGDEDGFFDSVELDDYDVDPTYGPAPENYINAVMNKLSSGKYKGVWVFQGLWGNGKYCNIEKLTPSNCKEVADTVFDRPRPDGYEGSFSESGYPDETELYECICGAGDSRYDSYTPEDFELDYPDDAMAYYMRYID